MKRSITALGIAALAAGTLAGTGALAGSPAAPVTEPQVAAPAAPMTTPRMTRDWTGPYAGAQLGWGRSGSAASGDGAIGGLHLGYLQDFGGFAAGVEGSFDAARIGTGLGGRINEVGRLGVRGGATTGDLFFYATGGIAYGRASNIGSDDGWFAGIGAEMRLTEQWSVGGELLHHRFRNFNNTGANVNANTLQARVTFRF